MHTIVGIFRTRAAADQALNGVLKNGVPQQSIIFLTGDQPQAEIASVPTTDAEPDGIARLSVPMLAVLWELAQDYIWAVLWLAWWFLAWVRYSLLESALLLLSDWVVPRPAARLAMQPNTRWMKVFLKMTSLCIVNC